jgi:hypothetical protein
VAAFTGLLAAASADVRVVVEAERLSSLEIERELERISPEDRQA